MTDKLAHTHTHHKTAFLRFSQSARADQLKLKRALFEKKLLFQHSDYLSPPVTSLKQVHLHV